MFQITTIITPIQYATKLYKAVDCLNASHRYKVNNLDVCILNVLHEAHAGMQPKYIMLDVRRRIYVQRFGDAIARLMDAGLIHKTKNKRYVYYTITVKGKQALKELDTHLIALTAHLTKIASA